MLWYETDAEVSTCSVTKLWFWLSSLSCAMARKLTSKGLETFSSCPVYTCETAYHNMVAAVKREHHLPDQCRLSAHWTAQNRRPSSLSTRGWAGESSRQWISNNATFDCSSSSPVWVCRRLTLASVYSIFGCAEGIALHSFFAATLQNFSYEQVMRVQAQGEQLHQMHLVVPCRVVYRHIRFGQWSYLTYCVLMYRRFAVLLCVPPANRRFAGFSEWLMNADAEAD